MKLNYCMYPLQKCRPGCVANSILFLLGQYLVSNLVSNLNKVPSEGALLARQLGRLLMQPIGPEAGARKAVGEEVGQRKMEGGKKAVPGEVVGPRGSRVVASHRSFETVVSGL